MSVTYIQPINISRIPLPDGTSGSIVSTVVQWGGVGTPQNIRGGSIAFTGDKFVMDVASLASSNAQNLKPMKAMQITHNFIGNNNGTYVIPGPLMVAVENTNQFFMFGPSVISQAAPATPPLLVNVDNIMTTVVPLVANSPTKITVGLGGIWNTNGLSGTTTIQLFDFHVDTFYTYGFVSGFQN